MVTYPEKETSNLREQVPVSGDRGRKGCEWNLGEFLTRAFNMCNIVF